jgi:ribosomal protein S18 acetylase RimI-like enzyme
MTAVAIRRARPGDCDAIADMVRALGRDTRADTVPRIRGDTLRAEAFGPNPLLRLWVAEVEDGLAGMLIGVEAFSTWRDGRGLYVCDLWVDAARRGARIGERLVAEACRAAAAEGMGYLKLEIIGSNRAVGRFYERLGFTVVEGDVTWVLERPGLERLAGQVR